MSKFYLKQNIIDEEHYSNILKAFDALRLNLNKLEKKANKNGYTDLLEKVRKTRESVENTMDWFDRNTDYFQEKKKDCYM